MDNTFNIDEMTTQDKHRIPTFKNSTEDSFNLYTLLSNYLSYWPWFAGSILLFLAATYLYLQYQTPVYNIKSAVLIKEQDNQQNRSNHALTAIQDLGIMSMSNNFDNELQIMKSQTLIGKVVENLELYIDHNLDRTFGYPIPLYDNEPVKVYMSPEEAERLEDAVHIRMNYDGKQTLLMQMEYSYRGKRKKIGKTFRKLPTALPTEIGVITFTPDTTAQVETPVEFSAKIITPSSCAAEYGAAMSITPVSKTTTIAQIQVHNTVRQRGIDFIYELVDIYNQEANDEKNEVAQKTAEFIEERIDIINRELGNTENTLAHFKQRSRLTNLTSDAQMALQETSKYEEQLTETATQINLVQDLDNYINNPAHRNDVIPANVGIEDSNLAHVINQYNTMMMERQRLLRTSSENNPAVIRMNSGIEAMRTTVQTSVNSVLRGLEMAQKNLQREAKKHEGRINMAPTQEKEYMSISRQQEIKASLYTMLLQKREENAITLASTASNGRIIENPVAGKTPIAPEKKVYFLSAVLLGTLVPVIIMLLKESLKYKIENRSDVEKMTNLPILVELPKGDIKKSIQGTIVIHENRNDLMEEAFRHFRTNLLFMLTPTEKVIMVTSSQPSEGKSFIAGNLAVSFAYLGKKTLIVGLDIRKSGMDKVFGLTKGSKGITDYLSQPENHPLSDLIKPSGITPQLDILPRGTLPPNPTELIARNGLEKAIEELKERYDLIILDTAPIAMVTDTSLISRVADICIYVCRADYTPKVCLKYLQVLQEQPHFCKMAMVLNAIDLSKRKNSINHRYGYGYGYGYGEK